MLPILLVATAIAAVIVILGCTVGLGRSVGYYVPKWWARLFCWLTPVRVVVRGRQNIRKDQSYVFVANHQGAYDIFSVYGYLNHNFRWMMKRSLERIPLVGFSCKACGHIMVDNSSPTAIRHTMEKAEKQLSQGMSVVVFPEGSRTPDGEVHAFKRGAYMLATEFNLPVVPLTIDGAYHVMSRRMKAPRPGKIVITIHKPIEAGAEGHDVKQLIEQSRQVILSALQGENVEN